MEDKDMVVLLGAVWVAPISPDLVNIVTGGLCVALFLLLSFKKD